MKEITRHSRKAIDTENDPYLQQKPPADLSVCGSCEIVYHNKRWYLPEDIDSSKSLERVTCPACQKIRDNYAGGYVSISGEFQSEHRPEIINLVKNKEKVAMRHNPLDRIIKIDESGEGVEISTTTERLAQRIGRILKKTYEGTVEYRWSSKTKLSRVTWKR